VWNESADAAHHAAYAKGMPVKIISAEATGSTSICSPWASSAMQERRSVVSDCVQNFSAKLRIF
jgi:hypothetical protein